MTQIGALLLRISNSVFEWISIELFCQFPLHAAKANREDLHSLRIVRGRLICFSIQENQEPDFQSRTESYIISLNIFIKNVAQRSLQ
jgi:hypothetical protein